MNVTRTRLHDLDLALSRLRRFWHRPQLKARVFAELGPTVTPTLYTVLRAVATAESEDPCVGDVATALDIDASTASRFVADAVAVGHLERSVCEDDRRRSRLGVTPEGQALLDRGAAIRFGLLSEMTAGWPDEDVAALAGLLERLGDAARDLA
jgi:DNA-binding MarR family transcriptional regulator